MAVVERDDGLVEWTGVLGQQLRPVAASDARRVLQVIFVMYVFAILPTAFIGVGWIPTPETVERGELLAQNVPPGVAALAYFAWVLRRPDELFLRLFPATTVVGYLIAVISIARGLDLVGSEFGVVAVYYVEAPLIVFFLLRFRWALGYTAFMMGCYAIGLRFVDGVASPAAHWVVIFSAAVVSGFLMGGLASSLLDARTQLANLNRRLRRFLAPQVADVLTAGDDGLAPHKREIAVFFVDLRGFTAFTNTETAERVVAVLADYYDAVGTVVHRYGGTIGGLDGDGVFAFLGDPTPNANAAADAVAMAKDVALALDAKTAAWDLGYGIGLAYGEATVGLVGFEGRLDYTPVGACVNLAARLCADARPGEIVVDDALRNAARLGELPTRRAVDLKGFGEVPTYAVAR